MRTTTTRRIAVLFSTGIVVATFACGSGGTDSPSTTAGDASTSTSADGAPSPTNAADCPSAPPAGGSSCPREELACSYGSGCSATYAKCTGGRWTIEQPSCPVQAATCLPAGGECTCAGSCPSGTVQDPSKTCPEGPPNSGACGQWCCMPSDAGADAPADG